VQRLLTRCLQVINYRLQRLLGTWYLVTWYLVIWLELPDFKNGTW
jgi:hypothetical protein